MSRQSIQLFIEAVDRIANREGPYVEAHAARLGVRLEPLMTEPLRRFDSGMSRWVTEHFQAKRNDEWVDVVMPWVDYANEPITRRRYVVEGI